MRFNIKTLMVMTAIVATLLAAFLAVERGYSPNPNSEQFEIHGVNFEPKWISCESNTQTSGLMISPVAISHNYQGRCDNEIRQPLFEYQYNDNFGNSTFDIQYDIEGRFNDDWSEYLIDPIVSGGGNTGANASIQTDFDATNRTLIVIIRQGFNTPNKTKECTLKFTWNGKIFRLQNAG